MQDSPDWMLPDCGVLQVDFVPTSRLPVEEKALADPQLIRIWSQIICYDTEENSDKPLTDEWKLNLLQVLCIDYFFTSAQAKCIVDTFFHGSMKIEAAVLVSLIKLQCKEHLSITREEMIIKFLMVAARTLLYLLYTTRDHHAMLIVFLLIRRSEVN